MIFGFDIISDLNLTENDTFDWEGKPTSLYCILAGNISNDLAVLYKTVKHLSTLYQGIFYIDGTLENNDINDKDRVVSEIFKLFSKLKNVVYLHDNVVVVENVALVGVNGWYNAYATNDEESLNLRIHRYADLVYLQKTIEKLQLHVDVKNIIVISNSVPAVDLYFGESPQDIVSDEMELSEVVEFDTENKITTWVFGTHKKIVDTRINGINYFNNPCYNNIPYYPKRINIEF
jgi:predicted phosphohydrolase